MLDSKTINNQNLSPENLHIAMYEGVIVNAIYSQGFLFGESDMSKSKFKRLDRPLCACGCGMRVVKKQNKYIVNHFWKGKKRPEHSKIMSSFGENHWAKSQKFIDNMTGDNNPMKRKEVKEKHTRIMGSKEVREKKSKSALALGDNHPTKRPEVAKKISQSKIGKKRLDITGNNHPMKKPENRAKVSGKNNGFYGETHTKKVKSLLSKLRKGKKNPKQSKYMLNGGSAHSLSFRECPSKPQTELFELIKQIYSNVKIEYLSLKYHIDIAIPDLMIAIEYDGSYWHKDQMADDKRQQELESIGWKFLRYRDYIPSMDKLKRDLKNIGKK